MNVISRHLPLDHLIFCHFVGKSSTLVVIMNDLRQIIGYQPTLLLLIFHFFSLNLLSLLFVFRFSSLYRYIYISSGMISMIFHPESDFSTCLLIFKLCTNMYEVGLTCTNLNMKMHAEQLPI